MAETRTRPFLKWAGGKQWLAHLFPTIFAPLTGTYFEPFLGGGSAFFAAAPSRAFLSDSNPLLIETFSVVRDEPEAVIDVLEGYEPTKTFYDAVRRAEPSSDVLRAARFIFLNKTAFNGLYRVNARGEFNVPFGSFRNPGICQPDRIRCASVAMRQAEFEHCDFEQAIARCTPGDVVYLDPPYITGHQNNGFHKYNAKLFSWEDQQRLAVRARKLALEGTHVFVTNADHPSVIGLFEGFFSYRLPRTSLIGGGTAYRRTTTEVLLSSRSIEALEHLSTGVSRG